LAYDENQSAWSAGTVLSAHLFQHALDVDRVVEIDYLTGDDAYKSSWMTHRRDRIGLMACNLRSLRGVISTAAEVAGQMKGRFRSRPVAVSA
jgi:CelD/BcsL family acetyltransferase involved in cellulose biosynthesis